MTSTQIYFNVERSAVVIGQRHFQYNAAARAPAAAVVVVTAAAAAAAATATADVAAADDDTDGSTVDDPGVAFVAFGAGIKYR